ncbi:MAG: SAM-dependent DNA methyltransferase [Cyanobacteria bacterium]|nr:SAM-dependent DNA methyltransferase [Cyanobacteria bacterium CG_2015-16_32_12]NCO77471.1 SAM-dependent DNA methyltransferase [Cyanobacteria bacterium CG_2015-22_32_23]NCQ04064.1 SAM-dependent DNA methyltransferase [Cyanobacteria bacterium CG_2015-09_32_10]NCQ42419.1 SAM-dependent DNA methyltransferase [Cyanobacteria bacterium CG_2015-04_32_10]NCS84074.1 SAM-dependent DNA methyltransferase [Cyanobacteria bacterium CG_2015-02_32_10]
MAKLAQKKADTESFEQKLWKTADKLRKNIDAAEYKHIVLGLIFLKYISDAFEELYQKLIKGEGEYAGADAEDKDEYVAENVFFVPLKARWAFIQAQGKQPNIGQIVDEAMDLIERENSKRLKGILPKVFGQQKLDSASLGGLIDLISKITLGDAQAQAQDVLGRVYEYFLGQFALNEGKNAGQFYTPESIVRLLVEMLEPYSGRIFDPCCGSGGMFVQSEKFIEAHQGRLDDISIYGQESNETTYKLCRMNLAIRGIDGSNIKWNPEGSFLNDAHKDLKADFVIANPPFNDSDWSGDLLKNDGRWQYGIPPAGNANFGWVQHFLYHLAPTGRAGFVLSNGSLSSNTSGEGDIRKALVEADLVDCIVMLPTQLFYNTGIPACLWFMSRGKSNPLPKGEGVTSRKGEVLFIDASELGYMVNRKNRAFTYEDIAKIADTYHQWKKKPSPPTSLPQSEGKMPSPPAPLPRGEGSYKDVKGFCKSATLADIEKHNFVLTPGRYVGIPDEEDDGIAFEETMEILTKELAMQMREGLALDEEIKLQLEKVGFALEVD